MSVEYEITPRKKPVALLKEIRTYSDLLYFLIWRDLKVKYKQTALGMIWVILQPLLISALVSVVIIKGFGVADDNGSYPLFIFSGYILWMFFSSAVSGASTTMVSNAHIIKKIYFPRILLPFSAILSILPDLLILMLFTLIAVQFIPNAGVDILSLFTFWPVAILVSILAATGIGLFFSALQVRYRDVKFIVPFILQLGMFASPVFYPIPKALTDIFWVNVLLSLNPMKGAMELFRTPFNDGIITDEKGLIISIISSLFIFISGVWYFLKTEKNFADIA